MKPARPKSVTAVRIAVVLTTGAILYFAISWRTAFDSILKLSLGSFVAAVAISLARVPVASLRWMLLHPHGRELGYTRFLYYSLITAPAGFVLPGVMGADLAKSALMLRAGSEERHLAVLSVLVDRYVGGVSIALLTTATCLSVPSHAAHEGLLAALFVVDLVFLGAWLAALSTSLNRLVAGVAAHAGRLGRLIDAAASTWSEGVLLYRSRLVAIASALALSTVIHLAGIVAAYVLALDLNLGVSFLELAVAVGVVWVLTMLPISFSGIGVREVSFAYFLGLWGVAPSLAVGFSLCFFAVTIATALVGVPVLWIKLPAR